MDGTLSFASSFAPEERQSIATLSAQLLAYHATFCFSQIFPSFSSSTFAADGPSRTMKKKVFLLTVFLVPGLTDQGLPTEKGSTDLVSIAIKRNARFWERNGIAEIRLHSNSH